MGYVKNRQNSYDEDEGSSVQRKGQVQRRPKLVLSDDEDSSYVAHTRTVKRRRMTNVYKSDDEETTSVSESSDDSSVVSSSDETISGNEEYNWEFEADMLADFGKSSELCMSAVCALFRQQTADERRSKVTNLDNKRGFSRTDAKRGTKLARSLTQGNRRCELTKTEGELNQEELEYCTSLAFKYSKQLFELYKSQRDPYFAPH